MNILLKILYYGILSFSIMVSPLYIWHKLLDKKINFRDYKLYVTLISLMIIALINYFNVNPYIRISIITFALMIFFRFLFKESLQKCIITPIFSQMLVMVSEMFFVVVVCIIFNFDNQDIINTQFGKLFSNVLISILAMLSINIPIFKKIYYFILKITDKIKKNQLIIISFALIIISNLLVGILYYKIEFRYLLVLNTLLTLFCLFIVMYSFKTKNNYIKVYDKYNTTLNSLKEYEDILDRYRVSNHENKKQLLTIRNMVPKTSKKVINYIDAVVENKLKDNDKVMLETAKIPAGGLRGLIYSKVLVMKALNINYELEISNEVRTFNLIDNIDDSTKLDICKIMGVYLDNAIQAVENLKERYINIEMYLENKDLIISVSNNYDTIIDIDKIEEKGYTSKGKGHGYGLTLAKEIIDNNKKLSNQKKMSKETFTQMLKIKM